MLLLVFTRPLSVCSEAPAGATAAEDETCGSVRMLVPPCLTLPSKVAVLLQDAAGGAILGGTRAGETV